jgi:hypothetical protein
MAFIAIRLAKPALQALKIKMPHKGRYFVWRRERETYSSFQQFQSGYKHLIICWLPLPYLCKKIPIFFVHQKYTSEKKSCLETNGKV